ncbi:DUF3865 domain-containing protein [Leptolyngbya sp. FACHB-711]|uniref:DUF3865 domain-containing protein n=1 Tax=unclassified Leptolyngbya TaxID=2650499 RepID=UPI0016826AB8|nr:DUF3865 domain-containing protein [Leptolyngbya sp. FACHB-711]MBD2024067.1 DUF3865 domain-containing protein [Leptolyngbya sp. FACHB-711]
MNEFNALTLRLCQTMSEEYVAVHAEKNPVVRISGAANVTQITCILQQYSILPKALVVLLEAMRNQASIAGWDVAMKELDDNLAEELGSKTQGIPHADLLAEGLETALKVPIKAVVPSTATAALLERLEAMTHQPIAYLSGAAFAVEATAVPELQIIVRMLNLLLEGAMPEQLRYFFEMHLNEWEPEHEANLRKAIAHHLKPEHFKAFEIGFRAMLTAMDAWWSGLAAEALTQQIVEPVYRYR